MAGAKLTKFLKPEKLQLYISLQKTNVMKLIKLVPDTDGTIELLNIFWNNQIKSGDRNKTETVSPLIVYADLLASHIAEIMKLRSA
ncbi:MAG: type IV toxin-antitoxin system AbiEi family antitoxin [Ginsengibacter sp.]